MENRISVVQGKLSAGGFPLTQDSGAVGIIEEKNHQCLSTKALVAPRQIFEELLRQPDKMSTKNYLLKVKNDLRRVEDLFVIAVVTSTESPFVLVLDPVSNELLRITNQNLISLPENLVCISSKVSLPGRQ